MVGERRAIRGSGEALFGRIMTSLSGQRLCV